MVLDDEGSVLAEVSGTSWHRLTQHRLSDFIAKISIAACKTVFSLIANHRFCQERIYFSHKTVTETTFPYIYKIVCKGRPIFFSEGARLLLIIAAALMYMVLSKLCSCTGIPQCINNFEKIFREYGRLFARFGGLNFLFSNDNVHLCVGKELPTLKIKFQGSKGNFLDKIVFSLQTSSKRPFAIKTTTYKKVVAFFCPQGQCKAFSANTLSGCPSQLLYGSNLFKRNDTPKAQRFKNY